MRFLHAISLLLILMLTGCGFHLRGMVNADGLSWLNNIAIVIQQAHRDLEPSLRDQLQAYGIRVVADPILADYWLILDNEVEQQNISSISSSTTPRQYEITYSVNFKLQRRKGSEVIPPSKIVITRQITLNSNRILGSDYEEDQQKREMRQDAVIQIINRLSRSTPKTSPPKPTIAHY